MRKDGLVFKKSTRKGKKYDAFLGGKKIASFGGLGYQHYKDKIGLYSGSDHLDKERRRLYYARHGKSAKKYTPKYFSHKYLW